MSNLRQLLGNVADWIGGRVGIPETGLSERIAGGPTRNTGNPVYASNVQGPVYTPPSGGGGSWGPATTPIAKTTTTKTTSSNYQAPQQEQQQEQQQDPQQEQVDPYAGLRNEISSGWDSYINSLNDQLNGLEGQRTAQEGIATSNAQQNINTLDLQRGQGLQQLGTQRDLVESNQTKTLRDLSSNLRNSFMAGNVYLGARGAGDSSAANQYALALTKEGSRQRSDIMQTGSDQLAQIGLKETDLNNIYNTEKNNIEQEKQSKVAEIANWFYGAQNQIKQAQSQGQLGKSQDLTNLSRGILDQAISAMNKINSDLTSRSQALESWAISQSNNINELKANMKGISNFTAQLPGYSQIAGTPQVDSAGNIFTSMTGAGGRGRRYDENGNLIG